eukprot:3934803-Rhodomonas_salina.1
MIEARTVHLLPHPAPLHHGYMERGRKGENSGYWAGHVAVASAMMPSHARAFNLPPPEMKHRKLPQQPEIRNTTHHESQKSNTRSTPEIRKNPQKAPKFTKGPEILCRDLQL